MKYYLRHFEDDKGKWIVEFDDDTKEFHLYMRDEGLDDWEAEEIKVKDGQEVFENTEGSILKRGLFFNKAIPIDYICGNGHEFKSTLKKLDVVCPICQSLNVNKKSP